MIKRALPYILLIVSVLLLSYALYKEVCSMLQAAITMIVIAFFADLMKYSNNKPLNPIEMKKPTPTEIKVAKETLKAAGFIETFWHIDDIIGKAKDNNIKLTKKQAHEIADLMHRRHDASIGINWEVIDIYIDEYLNG